MATTRTDAMLVTELNDLLQLDHDAVQAYGFAIDGLSEPERRQTLMWFRGDHERHVRELTDLIKEHDGVPVQLPHLPTGPMKLAVQAVGNMGNDREVLLAFRSNERQVRDKYRRMADRSHSPDVAEVLSRAAADEERHYNWVSRELERMGVTADTGLGRAADAFETGHARSADMIESAERKVMHTAEQVRRSPVPAIVLGLASVLLVRRFLK